MASIDTELGRMVRQLPRGFMLAHQHDGSWVVVLDSECGFKIVGDYDDDGLVHETPEAALTDWMRGI